VPIPLRIIIVEDVTSDALLVVDQLQTEGFEVNWTHVDTADRFLTALGPDIEIILSDYSLPIFGALEALTILAEQQLDIPLIVISGTIGEEVAVASMKAGASDYLLKDRLGRLGHAVRSALELRKTRRAIRQAESDLYLRDRAIAALSYGLVIADAKAHDLPLIYANASFLRMTGYSLEEVLGRNCRFLQGPASDWQAVQKMRKALEAQVETQVDLINYRKDGTPFWCQVTLSPIHDTHGQVTHFVGTQNDVSEGKQLQQQLLHVQKMEAIGTLAGGIAHDFNNLLTVILGSCELLQEGLPDGSPHRELVESIEWAGNQASTLTQRLLVVGRRHEFRSQIIDLSRLVSSLTNMLGRVIGEDVQLLTHLDTDIWPVKADWGCLEQVLMNLVANARDAMPTGGQLVISVKNQPPTDISSIEGSPSRFVVLSVSDTGCGIDQEIQSRIFDPFFTTKGPEKGTGLGLSIVFSIVKQAGGTIQVISNPGRGTTFEVALPAVDGPQPEREFPSPHLATGSERLLFVEDEAAVRAIGQRALESAGYRVIPASSAQAVLDSVDLLPSDIVLLVTDVIMPGLSGWELAQKLQTRFPALKTLFVSGFPDDEMLRHGLETGSTLLPKPYTSASLTQAVRAAIDNPTRPIQ